MKKRNGFLVSNYNCSSHVNNFSINNYNIVIPLFRFLAEKHPKLIILKNVEINKVLRAIYWYKLINITLIMIKRPKRCWMPIKKKHK